MSTPIPTEQQCLLHHITRDQAAALDAVTVLRAQETLLSRYHDLGDSTELGLVRGAIHSLYWRLTSAQYDAGRLARLLHPEGDQR